MRFNVLTIKSNHHRHMSMMLLLILVAVASTGPATGQEDDVSEQNRRCLNCHGQPHIAELTPQERLTMVGTLIDPEDFSEANTPETFVLLGDESATRPGIYVTDNALSGTLHEGLACVECHEDAARLPHAPRLNLRSCGASCHAEPYTRYMVGAHNTGASEDVKGPGCSTCHSIHDMLPTDSQQSSTHPLKMVELCAQCHLKQTATTLNNDSSAQRVERYMDSIHGHLAIESGLVSAATCRACHDNHRVLPASDPLSSVHWTNIPETCGQCHIGIAETYATSIHGQLFDEGDDRAPSCVDCHTAHGISDTRGSRFMLDIIEECGECHNDPELENGLRLTFYESYRRSYHGQVTKLGSTRAARCSDCHGSHDILPLEDLNSRVSADRLTDTCGSCHPAANANFIGYDPHADYRDRHRNPVLFGIWIYFIIVMSSAFGFFGMHTLLWFARSAVERVRYGPRKHYSPQKTSIRRFNLINRFNHALTAISFFGLTTTGIPLLFAEQPWARPLVDIFGGVIAAGIWHRAFAVILIINAICFFSWLVYSAVTRTCTLREWFFGPTSLVPNFKDCKDCVGMFRWFFRGGQKPSFECWTYWEKFDFWCEIGGTAIIGGSGLLLWFPSFFSLFMPGWIFNAATVTHGFEALLAIGFIFTIHFFNANLRYEKFPMDDVMFTGHMPEEELAEERPLQYERIKKSGKLEQLRVETAPPWARVVSRLVGVTLMMFGLALITLIILAGLEVLQ